MNLLEDRLLDDRETTFMYVDLIPQFLLYLFLHLNHSLQNIYSSLFTPSCESIRTFCHYLLNSV